MRATGPAGIVYSKLTRDLYTDFLARARAAGYTFASFRDTLPAGKFILLRHDIDFSPRHALMMAELESEHGVASTYFVLADGQFYSVLDRETVAQLRGILALGHDVGVHVGMSTAVHADFGREVAYRARILEDVIERPVRLYCQHDVVNAGRADAAIDGYVDVATFVAKHDLLYVSDSGKLWRKNTFHSALGERSLCLLAHPHSWMAGVDDYVELIRGLEAREVERIAARYDAFVENLAGYYAKRREERL